MAQEISVSFQAVKSKVYKLIDAAVEGEKNDVQITEALERWWSHVHPADRAVAQKYLQRVLERSQASLNLVARATFEAASAALPPEGLAKVVNGDPVARAF